MGVLGLWTLLEPVGKPVPVESLSEKVLAVDISIWLNQAVRGFRDSQGSGVANAHLLGLYHRICKLLFYRIKPVFVFDGAPPQLKRETLARRRMKRSKESRVARDASEKILSNYLQRQAVAQKLNRQTHAVENALKQGAKGLHRLIRGQSGREKDLFELPELPEQNDITQESSSSDSETEMILESVGLRDVEDVYQVDVESSEFQSLPANLQYEVLTDLKGKRKQNSWASLHQMPREAASFSGFQLERLKRRRQVQSKLEDVVEDISRNSLEMMDSKLFVGDKAGMKQMKRRMLSRPDTDILLMSGLSQSQQEEEEEDDPAPSTSSGAGGANMGGQLRDGEQDSSIAVAESLSSDDLSQEQILKMIKTEMKTDMGDNSIEDDDIDDDDIVVLMPTTSLFTSNRMGGRGLLSIKDEPEEIQISDTEQTQTISESDSESDDDFEEVVPEAEAPLKEEEDMFADVFTNAVDIEKIDSIVSMTKLKESPNDPPPNPPLKPIDKIRNITAVNRSENINEDAEEILERITKLDKPGDILADIVSRANKKQNSAFTKEVSDNLKNGPGIMMKIASKWADAELKKSSDDGDPEVDCDDPPPVPANTVLEEEQDKLVQEMEKAEKEKRLLRLTAEGNADLSVKTVSKDSSVEICTADGAKENDTVDERLEKENDTVDERLEKNNAVDERLEKESDAVDDKLEDVLDDRALESLQSRLAAEEDSLVAELSKAERLSSSITDQMYSECQQLLQMFGLPWLVAPGEAEAQCAQLDQAGLTQGTITDDSDIWLFGGSRVYKNFFNQEKYVEFYNGQELVTHFGLTRDKLICLALLTGSDYTEGVETVGPVTALEILAEFPGEDLQPLIQFRDWSARVKGEMGAEFGLPVGNKTREKLLKLKLPASFPSETVVSAYLKPSVDHSEETFSWAVPNLVAARDFAREKFGWDRLKIDRLLSPVVRAMEARQGARQTTIDSFYSSHRVRLPDKGLASTSRRVEEAIRKVKGIKTPEKQESKKKETKQKGPKSSSSISSKPKPAEVSLIAQSCGVVIAPSRDDIVLQKVQREAKAKEAKEKAAEILRKSRKAKAARIQKKFKRPKRIELEGHGLSESDSD